MPSLQALAQPRGVDRVNVKEPDAELQLVGDAEVLVLEGAGQPPLLLASARVVSPRPQVLGGGEQAELGGTVAQRRGPGGGLVVLHHHSPPGLPPPLTLHCVTGLVVQLHPQLTRPVLPLAPRPHTQPVKLATIGPLVLETKHQVLPHHELVTPSQLGANEDIHLVGSHPQPSTSHLPQLPVVVLCVERLSGATPALTAHTLTHT